MARRHPTWRSTIGRALGYSVGTMSLKRFLIVLALAVVLGVGGVILWAFNTDLGRFEPRIERWLSGALERETRFGALRLELGRSVYVEARDLRIANRPGAEDPDLLRLESLEGSVALASLFDDGPILVERLAASGLDLNLAWDEAGTGNWPLAEAETGAPSRAAGENGATARVIALDARIDDARVVLAWPTHANRLDLEGLQLAENSETGMLDLSVAGRVDDAPLAFDGRIGPRSELATGGAVTLEGEGRYAGLQATGRALLDDLDSPDRPELELELGGSDVRELEQLLGLDPGPRRPFEFTVGAGDEGGTWRLDLDGRIGEFTLAANGDLSGLQRLERVRLDVDASGPDLDTVLRLFRIEDAPAEAFEFRGLVQRDGPVLAVEDVRLDIGAASFDLDGRLSDFPHLRNSTLDLDVHGPDIAAFRALFALPGAAEGDFELTASLAPGEGDVEVLDAHLVTNLGTMDASGTLTRDERYLGSVVSLSARGRNAVDTFSQYGLPGLGPEPFTVDAEFRVGEEGVMIERGVVDGLWNARLEAGGRAGWEPLENGTDLDLSAEGTDLATSLADLALGWPLQSGPYTVTARLRATPAGIRIDGLTGSMGRSSLQADALIPLDESLAGLDVTLAAEGPDLSAVFRDEDTFDVPSAPWAARGRLRRPPDGADARLVLEGAELRVAEIRLTGEGATPWPLRPGEGTFTLRGEGPDLGAAVPRIGDFRVASRPFVLAAAAEVRDGAWTFEPSHLELGEARVDVSGTVDALPDFSATDLALEIVVPDLAHTGTWAEVDLPALKLALASRLRGTPTRIHLDDYELDIGDSTATGRFSWDAAGDRPRLAFSLLADRLDLRGAFPQPSPENGGFEAGPDGRVIPDTPLPLAWLDDIDGTLDIEIGELTTDRRLVRDIRIDASLGDSALQVTRYRSEGIAGAIDARGRAALIDDERVDVELELVARDLMPARDDWLKADPATLPRINALGEARATGASLRELAANLNGRLRIAASEGTLPGQGLGALNAALLEQIFSILVPGLAAREPTELRCFATDLHITDGLVRPQPIIALHTSKLTVISTGTINLKDEKIDLQFQTTPSSLLGSNLAELANPFVSIEGTLAKPKPVIDPGRTIVYGGAAAATGGISLIAKAVWDRLRGASRPCERLRDELGVAAAVLNVQD